MKQVKITWLDHMGDSAWIDQESLQELMPAKAVSIGWLVYETDLALIICSSYLEPDSGSIREYGGWDLILKSCILHKEEI
mgnify:FL=1|tara:strand:- start:4830 stop:5069 length:240 start_codon:yes stop_codon:yes gene_type:complete